MLKIVLKGADQLIKRGLELRKLKAELPEKIARVCNRFGLLVIRTSKERYLTGPRPEKLGVVTGHLRASVRHQVLRSDKSVSVKVGVAGVPYAAIHEYGGVTHPRVTAQSRKFFWAKFYETGNQMWMGLALTKKTQLDVRIKKRPYLTPAVNDNLAWLKQNLTRTITQLNG